MEALQLGAVQMLAPSVSKFGPLGCASRGIAFLSVPRSENVDRVTDGEIGKAVRQARIARHQGPGYWTTASSSSRPTGRWRRTPRISAA